MVNCFLYQAPPSYLPYPCDPHVLGTVISDQPSAGSNASVVSPGSADTSFTPDLAGQYIVQVTVSDGSLGASAQATVTANAVVTNRPPVIVTVPSTVATVGASYSYDVDATDPDVGDTLSYALTTAPGNMSINPATGLISWSPTPAQLGPQSVAVRVADQLGAAVTQSFTVTVGGAPTPLQLAATLVPAIANAGETVTLTALVRRMPIQLQRPFGAEMQSCSRR